MISNKIPNTQIKLETITFTLSYKTTLLKLLNFSYSFFFGILFHTIFTVDFTVYLNIKKYRECII